jgi:O-antigen/teichoic acid export membrane protein
MSSSPNPVSSDSPAVPPRGRMARNTVNLVIGQVVTLALTVILNAAVARTLGPSDFGVLFLITSVVGFSYVFVDWGHGTYVVREIARTPHRIGDLMGSVMAVRAGTALLLAVPAVLIGRLLGYDGRTQIGIALMMLAWLPMYLGLSYIWAFRGIERMEFDALISSVLKFSSLASAMVLLLSGGRLFAMIVSSGIAGTITLVVATVIYRRLRLGRLRVSWDLARELMVGGAPMATMTVAVAFQPYVDANMLTRLAPHVVLGWYGAAYSFANTLMAPAAVLATAAFPQFSVAAADRTSFSRILHDALRPLLFVAVLGAVGTFLFADVAVGIVYDKAQFGPSIAILRAFTPAMVLVFLDMMLGTAILAAGNATKLATAKLLSIVVTSTLEYLLIPMFQARFGNGGIGVMVALTAGELVMVVAALRLLPKATLNRVIVMDFVRAAAAGAATLAIGRPLFAVLPPVIGIPGCVLLFFVLSMAFGLVSRNDINTVAGLLSRRRPRTADVPSLQPAG